MGALVDAALARQLRELFLSSCTPPAAAPLARLLAEGSLAHHLIVYQSDPVAGAPLFDAAGEALIAQALRVNTTLTKLVICQAFLGALELVGALAYVSLTSLVQTSPQMVSRLVLRWARSSPRMRQRCTPWIAPAIMSETPV